MIDVAELGFEQLPVFPHPGQLCLPEQLMLPIELPERVPRAAHWPAGVGPVEPPDAPAAIACVRTVLADACATCDVPVPTVRWHRAVPGLTGKDSYEWVAGFHTFGQSVIWLNVDYHTPEGLARTVAHEAVHYWQGRTRSSCVDALEDDEREGEAQRRAKLLVPKRSVKTPRGRKRDAWFEPARRRFGAA